MVGKTRKKGSLRCRIRTTSEQAPDRPRHRGLPRPRCTTGEGRFSLVGRNRISRPLLSRFRVKQRPKPATLQSLAILHHDIESA